MSFTNSPKSSNVPGRIENNPLIGLCEKVCIQVNRVFDACLNQSSLENYSVTLDDLTPPNPTEPLTFVSGFSTTSEGVIRNESITPIPDKPGFSRVQATVDIPVEIIYTDATDTEGKGSGIVTVACDVVMCVPTTSIVPTKLKATVNMVAPSGTWVSDSTFTITACVTILLKVEAEVDLLVPSYGYCCIPPCQEYTEEVCTGAFEIPLFPSSP